MPVRAKPPNVLLIIADDHRADALGVEGGAVVRTPCLDRLAQRGLRFSRAQIAGGLMAAVCSPSRAALLTGLHPFRADATPKVVRLPPYEVPIPSDACTLPQCFKDNGYETFFTGKWHNDLPALLRSFSHGEGIFHGGMCAHDRVPVRSLEEMRNGAAERLADGFSTEIFCRAAEDFIRQPRANRPFLACIALTSPHDPRTPPPTHSRLYAAGSVPLPINFQTAHPFDNGELEIRDEGLLPRPLSPSEVRAELAAYYGMISHHDEQIGRVLEVLQTTGAAEATVVAYVSDHGLALGSHGLLGKQNLYEHSVRVPFILAGPGVPSGRIIDGPVYAFDLYATLTALAGLRPPSGLDSRDLRPCWQPGATAPPRLVGAAYADSQRSISDGRWKLIVYHVRGHRRIQLFDLATDPHETRDLGGDANHAAQRRLLEAELGAWRRRAGDRWFREERSASDEPTQP
jgi:arylsulfatase A-like enzyme